MFDSKSRYSGIKTASHVMVNGREVSYVRRRFLGLPEAGTTLVEHRVTEGERLDNVTVKYLADPEAFWRICDANLTTYPSELTDEIGRSVRVALPSI